MVSGGGSLPAAALICPAMSKQTASRSDGWSERMHREFAAAKFSEASTTYDDAVGEGARPTYETRLLRARLFLKRDENKAVSFLVRHKPDKEAPRWRGLWHMYLAVGYARMRDFDRADHHFDEAHELLNDSKDLASLSFHRARRMLLELRVDDARRYIEEMSRDGSWETRVDQELLTSFAFAHQERYHDEAKALIKTLKMLGDERDAYLEPWFHAVENLAVLGRELAHENLAAVAKAEVDRDVEWPADFRLQRFQALKAVGWSRALRGDALGCFRYLRMAERAAPTDAFKAIVQVDRAHFARFVGERNWSFDELAQAEAIAESVDWNARTGDERVALLLLAESFAEVDAEKARYYLARFSGLDKIRSPLHLFAFDHRLDAMAAYAKGVVEMAEGDEKAEDSLRQAFVVFDDIRYDWRAGRTALALHRATGKERWLHAAEQKLKPYLNSWLGEELRVAKVGKPYRVQLPTQQQRVFEMLCSKMSTAEIAAKLNLSQHTVRNHLKAVFRAFGVHNRSALVAEAARRGELPAILTSPSPKNEQQRTRSAG